jgi:hypothetical protein
VGLNQNFKGWEVGQCGRVGIPDSSPSQTVRAVGVTTELQGDITEGKDDKNIEFLSTEDSGSRQNQCKGKVGSYQQISTGGPARAPGNPQPDPMCSRGCT